MICAPRRTWISSSKALLCSNGSPTVKVYSLSVHKGTTWKCAGLPRSAIHISIQTLASLSCSTSFLLACGGFCHAQACWKSSSGYFYRTQLSVTLLCILFNGAPIDTLNFAPSFLFPWKHCEDCVKVSKAVASDCHELAQLWSCWEWSMIVEFLLACSFQIYF